MSQELAVTRPPYRAISAQEFNTSMAIAAVLAQSKMFADVTDAAKAYVKMEQGRELGLGPITALREIHIIEGKAALSSNLIAALIQQSGRFTYRVVTTTEQEARIAFYENGDLLGESTVTMAEMSKVTTRSGRLVDGVNWRNYPKAMLFARAITSGARTYCPAVFMGGVYSADELGTPEGSDQGEYVEGESVEVAPLTYDPPPTPISEEQKATLNKLLRGRSGPSRIALLQNYGAANIGQLSADQADALIDDLSPVQAPVEDAPADVAEATAA